MDTTLPSTTTATAGKEVEATSRITIEVEEEEVVVMEEAAEDIKEEEEAEVTDRTGRTTRAVIKEGEVEVIKVAVVIKEEEVRTRIGTAE